MSREGREQQASTCAEVEDRLLEKGPGEAAALLASTDDPARAHLSTCGSCAGLAADLAALAAIPAVEAPEAVVEAALARAGAELAAVQLERRRVARRKALWVAAAELICLPLCVGWALLLWHLAATWIAPLLPQSVVVVLGAGLGFSWLVALSALVFTLTLLAGAGSLRPAGRPGWIEV